MTAPADKDNARYRKLREVEILDVKSDEITFVADARLCDATDESDVIKRRVQGTFVVRRDDLFYTEGGTVGGKPLDPSVKFSKGERGRLYIEDKAAHVKGTSWLGSVFARGVYDVSALLADEMRYRPKWPDGGADDGEDLYSDLAIDIADITLIGYVPGSKQIGEVKLLDSSIAPSQTLAWKGGLPVRVSLEKDGVSKFKTFEGETALDIWVLALAVKGKPNDGSGEEGTVDLRNLAHSAAGQDIKVKKGATVNLSLSPAGKKQFNWYEQNAREAVAAFEKLAYSHPELFELTRQIALLAAQFGADTSRLRSVSSAGELARELLRRGR